jgi:hypothetical protein
LPVGKRRALAPESRRARLSPTFLDLLWVRETIRTAADPRGSGCGRKRVSEKRAPLPRKIHGRNPWPHAAQDKEPQTVGGPFRAKARNRLLFLTLAGRIPPCSWRAASLSPVKSRHPVLLPAIQPPPATIGKSFIRKTVSCLFKRREAGVPVTGRARRSCRDALASEAVFVGIPRKKPNKGRPWRRRTASAV